MTTNNLEMEANEVVKMTFEMLGAKLEIEFEDADGMTAVGIGAYILVKRSSCRCNFSSRDV